MPTEGAAVTRLFDSDAASRRPSDAGTARRPSSSESLAFAFHRRPESRAGGAAAGAGAGAARGLGVRSVPSAAFGSALRARTASSMLRSFCSSSCLVASAPSSPPPPASAGVSAVASGGER